MEEIDAVVRQQSQTQVVRVQVQSACLLLFDFEELRGGLQFVVHVLVDLEDLVVVLEALNALFYEYEHRGSRTNFKNRQRSVARMHNRVEANP